MRDISSLATNEKLQNTGNRGNLAPTENQIKAIRFLVYNYKITISNNNLKNRRDTSQLITKIHNAISEGKIEERKSRPTNCKVKLVGDTWKLVQDRPTLDDMEYQVNGFARFVEQENERKQKKFMAQHEQWLNKQKKRV